MFFLLLILSATSAQFTSNSQNSWDQICQNGVCQQSGTNCVNGLCGSTGAGSPYQWGGGNPNWYQNGQYDPLGFYSGLGYPMNNPGCQQNPQLYGCPQGPMLPPQVPTIPQCNPIYSGCPGGPVFQGCTQQTQAFTPGCQIGGQITPIPGCTAQIAGCPGYVSQGGVFGQGGILGQGSLPAGCPQTVVPGCIQNPTVPGCTNIPPQCLQQINQIPYVRNFAAINKLSELLVKNSSSTTTVTGGAVPAAGSTPQSASFANGVSLVSLSAALITAIFF